MISAYILWDCAVACSVMPLLAHMVSKGESLESANITGWVQTLPLLALEEARVQSTSCACCRQQTRPVWRKAWVHLSICLDYPVCLNRQLIFELIFGLRVILLLETDKTRMTQE